MLFLQRLPGPGKVAHEFLHTCYPGKTRHSWQGCGPRCRSHSTVSSSTSSWARPSLPVQRSAILVLCHKPNHTAVHSLIHRWQPPLTKRWRRWTPCPRAAWLGATSRPRAFALTAGWQGTANWSMQSKTTDAMSMSVHRAFRRPRGLSCGAWRSKWAKARVGTRVRVRVSSVF